MRLMALPDDPGPVNLGNPRESTVRELAEIVHPAHAVALGAEDRAAACRRSHTPLPRHHQGPSDARMGAARDARGRANARPSNTCEKSSWKRRGERAARSTIQGA